MHASNGGAHESHPADRARQESYRVAQSVDNQLTQMQDALADLVQRLNQEYDQRPDDPVRGQASKARACGVWVRAWAGPHGVRSCWRAWVVQVEQVRDILDEHMTSMQRIEAEADKLKGQVSEVFSRLTNAAPASADRCACASGRRASTVPAWCAL